MSLEFSTLRIKFSDSHFKSSAYRKCGDPKILSSVSTQGGGMIPFRENDTHWFPMRIRNSSLTRLETMLERLNKSDGVEEAYAPLGFIKVNQTKMDFAPYLLNYIFVRSTFARLVKVKSNLELFEPLRFVMHPTFDEKYNRHNEVLVMSDKMMEDYKRLTTEENEKIIFLKDLKYACKPTKMVQITEGPFTGLIGHIKRIKGFRCVVVPIAKILAPTIVDVPNSQLRYLTEEEINDNI